MYHVCIISYRDVCFICRFHILLKDMANSSFLYYIVKCRDSTDHQNHNTCKTAKCLLNLTPDFIENPWNINKLIFNFYLYRWREMYEVGKWRLGKLYDHICTLDSWWCFRPPSYYSVQFGHSVVSDSLRPHGLQHTRLPCPSPTPRACSTLMSIELVMPFSYLILCRPLLLLPSIFPSIRVFSSELTPRIRWPKYWGFSFISPSNEYPGLMSFRMDWLDLLAVQGTLKSLLQHHSSKA